ncbi:MAG: hypothetical protein ABSH20_14295 [Tepidisphaeraceae bacterium]|jgi:hypothetical protein
MELLGNAGNRPPLLGGITDGAKDIRVNRFIRGGQRRQEQTPWPIRLDREVVLDDLQHFPSITIAEVRVKRLGTGDVMRARGFVVSQFDKM